ncbi:MAG: PD-(D/E)XK nuclease family protein [Deltaproteobacteria bacterium]|nr:PD-(D/E)XK nuclease family protein [Deltaproteobacteria bacterium]
MHRLNVDEISSLIRKGAPVLTVNKRLARHVRMEFDSIMRASGHSAWPTPLIIPLSAWVSSLWENSKESRPLLSDTRAKALWEKIILNDRALLGFGLLNPQGLAVTSFDAYSLIREYAISFPRDDIYLTGEARALKRWIVEFEGAVKGLGFLDRLSIPDEVAGLIGRGQVDLPGTVIIAGFDEFTPRTSRLIRALEKAGLNIVYWPDEPGSLSEKELSGAAVTIRPCEDEAAEAVQAARWIRTLGTGARIGIIVPELNKYRDTIIREFAAELNPRSVLPGSLKKDVFNISLGTPLISEPLVRSALDVLSIGEGKEDLSKMMLVLCSPYFSGKDYLDIASIDADLKERNYLEISLFEVRDMAERRGLTSLKERLASWLRFLRASRPKDLPSRWAEGFSKFLKDIGWHKHVSPSSEEYQALKALNALFEELASLDEIVGRISRQEAYSRISGLASDTMHQSESPECRVEVLGLLESAGLSFDHIWIMGCHEFALPRQIAPNPFIPIFLQKAYNLPFSSHEREALFAKQSLKRILNSASPVDISYPKISDGRELGLTPLLKGVGRIEEAGFTSSSRLIDSMRTESVIEETADYGAIPVGPEELKDLKGGTAVIKNQSLCPFKAFATHRLNAEGLKEPELGLSAAGRGSILHTALKLFWEKVVDSERLKELAGNGRMDDFVKSLSAEIMKEVDAAPLSGRFLEIERERLAALLKDWALVEAGRGPFKVKSIELEKEFDICGLKVKGRIDRVDEAEGGREIIIDYKSGEIDRNDWMRERPKDPQLLIYSLSGKFDAISFARIIPGECRFVGVSSADDLLPGIRHFEKDGIREKAGEGRDWDGLMELWKETVEGLAKEFLAGILKVDPNGELKGRQSPCEHCGLTVLCRITERGLRGKDGDESGE